MKIGIALAGGGVLCSAHVGVLKALEEVGIEFDAYAGTSGGSIVASLKALGKSNDEIIELMKYMNKEIIDIDYVGVIFSLSNKLESLDSLFKGDRLKGFLREVFGDATLKDLKHPLAITASDIRKSNQVIFTNGDKKKIEEVDDQILVINDEDTLLRDAVYASCALPGVFPPLRYDKMQLVDGGISNMLPVNILEQMGLDRIIGVDMIKRDTSSYVEGIFEIINRSLNIIIEQNIDLSLSNTEKCLVINPNLRGYSLFDFDKVDEIYEKGYSYTEKITQGLKIFLRR